MEHSNIKGYIYKITNPSGKVYIGQTTNLTVRKSKYRNLNCKGQTRLYKSLLKYGWEGHIFEVLDIIDVVSRDILNNLETRYIIEYDSFNKGLNCTKGGQGMLGVVHTKETRLKMRNAQLGRKDSKETIDKRTKSNKGKRRSSEFRESKRAARKGVVMSEDTKKKLSDINKGKILSEEKL